MIVQPSSTNPRGPVRRGARILGLVTPLVLLVVVVGAGILGPRPEPPAPPPSAAAVVPPAPGPAASPGPLVALLPAPSFPTVAADLAVRSVPDAQVQLAQSTGQPIAVAGWLTDLQAVDACPMAKGDTRGPLAPICARRALLLVAGPANADPTVHLHVLIPPGVRLPAAFEDGLPDPPMAVVLVGRAPAMGSPCTASPRGCGEQLTADRVMWADGAPFDPGPVFDAGLEVPPPAIGLRHLGDAETLATGWSGTILVAAVVRAGTLKAIDPGAYAAMASGRGSTGLVWYVRGLETAYDADHYPLDRAPPRLSWVVLDEATGVLLARGIDDAALGGVAASNGFAFPASVGGLPVRDVAAAQEARATPPGGGVTAVAGWFRAWADPGTCPRPIEGLPGGGCPRTGLLVAGPWSDTVGSTGEGSGPVIHVDVPPGVAIPDSAVGLPLDGLVPPPPVVVLGRFDAAGSLTVEAVLWASGQPITPGRQVATGTAAAANDPLARGVDGARTILAGAGVMLRMVLAPSAALPMIDPVAAAAVSAGHVRRSVALWYLRGLGDTGTIRWAVVEPGTGRVLARG